VDKSRLKAPLHEIARLVILYRARGLRPHQWASVKDEYHRDVITLTRRRHRLLYAAHAIGRDAHRMNPYVDEYGASAVAFVLADESNSPPHVVRRFLCPGANGEAIEDNDPRLAAQRAARTLPLDSPPYRTMGVLLKAWGIWVTGGVARELSWRDDAPMPRVTGWPAFRIPEPKETP